MDAIYMSFPELTIVVPIFNTGILLEACVCSIVDQVAWHGCVLPEFEIMLVDDSSTDTTTRQLLKSLPATDRRIRVITNQGPHGAAGARNSGVEVARGEWIAFLDSDDTWSMDSIARRWCALKALPDIQWICGDWTQVWSDGSVGIAGQVTPRLSEMIRRPVNENEVRRLPKPVKLVLHHVLPWTGTVLVRKLAFEKAGGFRTDLKRAEDYDLWLRLAVQHDIGFVPGICAFYLQRENSLTARGIEPSYRWAAIVLGSLIQDSKFAEFRRELQQRLIETSLNNCHEYRRNGQFGFALREALRLLHTGVAPMAALRQAAAALLRRD